jgi:hypothetical protein
LPPWTCGNAFINTAKIKRVKMKFFKMILYGMFIGLLVDILVLHTVNHRGPWEGMALGFAIIAMCFVFFKK